MTNVLITGANRGIGLELARHFAQGGAHVFATARALKQAPKLRELQASLPDKVSLYEVDVTSAGDVARLKSELGAMILDVLINNAGIKGPERQDADNMDYEGWAQTFAVNTMAPLRLLAALKDNLSRASLPRVITLTSQLGSITNNDGGYGIAYRTSKAAANQLMKSISQDYADSGIVSIALHPGWVRTDMGGARAPLSASDSAQAIVKLVAGLRKSDSGSFLQWNGGKLPW